MFMFLTKYPSSKTQDRKRKRSLVLGKKDIGSDVPTKSKDLGSTSKAIKNPYNQHVF